MEVLHLIIITRLHLTMFQLHLMENQSNMVFTTKFKKLMLLVITQAQATHYSKPQVKRIALFTFVLPSGLKVGHYLTAQQELNGIRLKQQAVKSKLVLNLQPVSSEMEILTNLLIKNTNLLI